MIGRSTISTLALAACGAARAPASPANLETQLRAQTQELLDAVTAGDPKVWDRYLDPQIFLRDDAGKVTRFADRREARDVVWTRR